MGPSLTSLNRFSLGTCRANGLPVSRGGLLLILGDQECDAPVAVGLTGWLAGMLLPPLIVVLPDARNRNHGVGRRFEIVVT
jgi:hypothetical protein